MPPLFKALDFNGGQGNVNIKNVIILMIVSYILLHLFCYIW